MGDTREEIRTVKCCKMVPREHCEVVKYSVCKVVPVHSTRKCCYTSGDYDHCSSRFWLSILRM